MISNSQKSPRAAKQGRVASVNLAVSWGFCLNPISSQWVRSEIVDDLGFSGLVVAPLLLWILVMNTKLSDTQYKLSRQTLSHIHLYYTYTIFTHAHPSTRKGTKLQFIYLFLWKCLGSVTKAEVLLPVRVQQMKSCSPSRWTWEGGDQKRQV